ncbi:unnamed protein product [Rhizophagus irregularis]|uniref:Uncharacterized protein n=1 Tax=Rhizophagus irregularis TaxID=588596 RepID=A0A915ZYS0_9GLOM|nr:unnamed protein product [Rhizophagus irregularis]
MFNLLNKIRFLKVKKCVFISDIARDFGEKFLQLTSKGFRDWNRLIENRQNIVKSILENRFSAIFYIN